MTELWAHPPGYPEHVEVSTLGNVRTKDYVYVRKDPTRGDIPTRVRGRNLALTPTHYGYLTASVLPGRTGRNVHVHRLVALAFLGIPPAGMEVNHKNGVKHDNRIENLEWVTRSENITHSHRHLYRKRPSTCRRVRVEWPDGSVREFPTMRETARHFGVVLNAVCEWLSGGGNKFGVKVREVA